jgi:exodeoxyribonuclease X
VKSSPNINTIDFETTGKEAAEAFAIEAALASPDDGAYGFETFIALPPGEMIPPETSAVHHIIDEDLEGAPDWDTVVDSLWGAVSLGGELTPNQVVMVAHNAEYEQAVLAGTIFDQAVWVCTFKCALVIWPQAPTHSNEGLRYWLRMGSGRKYKQSSHSALHDCKVTAGIFNQLYGQFHARLAQEGRIPSEYEAVTTPEVQWAIIEEMARVSREIAVLPTCPIGKERGKKWSEIDSGFLSWCLKQADMREDVKHAARQELDRRGRGRA